jgi:membrane-associated protease RseP (regulator of RpoE activity)
VNGTYLLGVVIFVVALLASVTLHEAGHFVMARRFGMKATQFFVGFGPTLFSRTRGETEYGIKAIPLGGFCKIVGMTPLEEVPPEDTPRAFYLQPAGRRAIVLVAGSVMHFIIAIVLTFVTLATLGGPDLHRVGVAAVESCVPLAETATGCAPGDPAGPAQAAGLRPGDRIAKVNGVATPDPTALVTQLRAHPGQDLVLDVRRGTRDVTLHLTPVPVQRHQIVNGTSTGPLVTVGQIGVQPAQTGQFLYRQSPLQAIAGTGDLLRFQLQGVWTTVTHKLGTVTQLFSKHRDPAGFVGIVGATRVSGDVLAATSVPLSSRIFSILSIIIGLNVFVGLFNLLPLLPLDGGHIAVVAYQKVRDTIRRRRGAAPMGPVDYARLMPITYAVAGLFLVFSVALAGADILNPIRIVQ